MKLGRQYELLLKHLSQGTETTGWRHVGEGAVVKAVDVGKFRCWERDIGDVEIQNLKEKRPHALYLPNRNPFALHNGGLSVLASEFPGHPVCRHDVWQSNRFSDSRLA